MQHIYPSRSRLLRFCQTLSRDPAEADESADAALCRAWEKLEQLDDPQYAERWLFSIAKHYIYNRGRRTFEPLPPEELLPASVSAEDAAMKSESMRMLLQLLRELSPDQRQAVYYCRFLGLSPAELAEALQVSSHVVSARLYRGLETLRKKWKASQ
ncbi:MAG: sigma-70 family RNA polymerase sigma factor [Firmicutes bacterium]|nr:sigma-70 family RNA polymerase sigma factor [Bacillota bacterium]